MVSQQKQINEAYEYLKKTGISHFKDYHSHPRKRDSQNNKGQNEIGEDHQHNPANLGKKPRKKA